MYIVMYICFSSSLLRLQDTQQLFLLHIYIFLSCTLNNGENLANKKLELLKRFVQIN